MSMFTVLAESNRRLLLDALQPGPKTVGELVDAVGLNQPAVSKHLRILRDAELVVVRPDGQLRWYELDPRPLREIDAWLDPYRRLWSDRLDRLEQHLDESDTP